MARSLDWRSFPTPDQRTKTDRQRAGRDHVRGYRVRNTLAAAEKFRREHVERPTTLSPHCKAGEVLLKLGCGWWGFGGGRDDGKRGRGDRGDRGEVRDAGETMEGAL